MSSVPNPTDRSLLRPDGTLKGQGFLGPLKHPKGGTSTELSIGVGIGGKETLIPTLVPTLTPSEVRIVLSTGDPKKIPDGIVQKVVDHAKKRMAAGLSPFAGPSDYRTAAKREGQLKALSELPEER